ncbi:hypothetical protein [Streptomyces sp. LaPpAH-108]|uniref:hypothetical protein n=1 Tax=Streptomyces sp. LaPpAH-108 TaxID=1155714 RepID=UPI00131A05CD|nr:hypothetical protein [Streptomyces sp. LaPpAH-108]
MEDRLEPESALDRLSERIVGVEKGQARHEEKLDGFRTGLHDVRTDLVKLGDEVTGVRTKVTGLEHSITDTRQRLDGFLEQYGRDREVSRAQAELSRLTTEWHAHFAQRKQTRALARSLVHTLTAQAVEGKVVNTATVRACSEERLLLEPTYWLAPATMAVAADFRREREQAERAQSHACALDAAKANLFFSLTCSRLGNETRAAAWMDLYLQSLDPDELGQDFCVVLDAVASRELGEKARGYTQQTMARWNRGSLRLSADSRMARGTRGGAHLESRLLNLRSRITEKQYAALRTTCGKDWQNLLSGWELATVPGGILTHLKRRFPDGAEGVDAPVGGGGHAESALDRLIEQLEPDEADMREKMRRLERVIEHEGDLEKATAAHRSSLAPDAAPVAFMTLLDQAVFEPDDVPLGEPARHMALRVVWPGLENAAQRFVADSRQRLPPHLTLRIAGWKRTVPTDSRTPVQPGPLVDELATHLERQTQAQSDAVVRRWPRVVAAVVMGVVAGALVVPFVDGMSQWMFGLLALALFGWAIWEFWSVPFRKKQVRDQGDRLRHEAVTTLSQALRQREEFFEDWRDAMDQLPALLRWGAPYRQD